MPENKILHVVFKRKNKSIQAQGSLVIMNLATICSCIGHTKPIKMDRKVFDNRVVWNVREGFSVIKIVRYILFSAKIH